MDCSSACPDAAPFDTTSEDVVHFLVGSGSTAMSARASIVPADSLLGTLVQDVSGNAPLLLPDRDPEFMRLLLSFWAEDDHQPPLRASRYRVLIGSSQQRHLRAALEQTRVTCFSREGYAEASPVPCTGLGLPAEEEPAAAFELATLGPTVLNEVRVRAVECVAASTPLWAGGEAVEDWSLFEADGEPVAEAAAEAGLSVASLTLEPHEAPAGAGFAPFPRTVPSFRVLGCAGGSSEWTELGAQGGAEGLPEARLLLVRNAPRRHLCTGELLAALLALPRSLCWAEAEAHRCASLTLSLARASLESKGKLKTFLGRTAGGTRLLLRAWPGKDAVQAQAAWWLASELAEGHMYTEPELYALIEAASSYQPDLGTIRKELHRRGCLEPPEIVQNADRTTSTYYRVTPLGRMREVLEACFPEFCTSAPAPRHRLQPRR